MHSLPRIYLYTLAVCAWGNEDGQIDVQNKQFSPPHLPTPFFPQNTSPGPLILDRDVQAALQCSLLSSESPTERPRSGVERGGSTVVGGKSERWETVLLSELEASRSSHVSPRLKLGWASTVINQGQSLSNCCGFK